MLRSAPAVAMLALAVSSPAIAADATKPPQHRPTHHAAARPVPVVAAPPVKPTPAAPAPVPAAPVLAAVPAEPAKGSNTGLPLPRFASLKTDEVNLRSGPGTALPDPVGLQAPRPSGADRARVRGQWRLDLRPGRRASGWVQPGDPDRAAHVRGQGRRTVSRAHACAATPGKRAPSAGGAAQDGGDRPASTPATPTSDWCQVQVGDYRGWLQREAVLGHLPQ